MSEPITGELTRHHDRPFYAQKERPRFFWFGCLGPLVVLLACGYFIFQGLTTPAGSGIARLFMLIVMLLILAQLIFGGTIFARTRSSLGKGLLLGGMLVLLLLLLGLIGIGTVLKDFFA